MTIRLEHVNFTVSDAKTTAKILCDIFDWKIRWQGPSISDGYSVHVGEENSYLALYTPQKIENHRQKNYEETNGLNHVGILVEDLDAIEEKVKVAGYEPHSHRDYEPGRRFYFHDRDGIEFEVISYS